MKKILEIFKSDVSDIFKNSSMLIVVISLCILPSLYAWFNIEASWDPYGSTGNIKVAIVNNDVGAKVNDKSINIGDELVFKLKDNTNLGWQFVSKEVGLNGVEKGDYYACIEIPTNFSENLTSVITKNVKKGELNYTVNEKINAIAPKITDKGASTIQLEVNQTIIKTLSGILLDLFKEIGIKIEAEIPKLDTAENLLLKAMSLFIDVNNSINLASNDVVEIENTINMIKQKIPEIQRILNDTANISKDITTFINTSKTNVNTIIPIIKNDISLLNNISRSLEQLFNKGNHILDNIHNIKIGVSAKLKLNTLHLINNSILVLLNGIDKLTSLHILDNIINNLEDINKNIKSSQNIIDSLQNNQISSNDALTKLSNLSNNIQVNTANILFNFDAKITNPINNIFDKSLTTSDEIFKTLNDITTKLPNVIAILDNTKTTLNKGKEGIVFARENIPKAQNMITELLSVINKIQDDKNLNELLKLSQDNISIKQNFLKEPVTINETKLYHIENYGSAMTPFYTVLSLWVGLLLLTSLISVDVEGNYKPHQVYFGRGLTYIVLAVLQALIVSIGDIILLGVTASNPALLVLGSIFTSIIFVFIVYTLISVLGNVGKSFGIILLVIQVAGSGGTFPVEVTPRFFQVINPYLPFTYAISMLREAIGGVYKPTLSNDIIILTSYIIISILVALVLKKPLNKLFEGFKTKFKQSRLSE